jgi:hypothetical protein
MDSICACCAGSDVPKTNVVACVRRSGPDGRVDPRVRTDRTMTVDPIAWADWLDAGSPCVEAAERLEAIPGPGGRAAG